MESYEKELNGVKINDIYSSLEFQSDFGMAKISFYTFKEKLIYENKYLLNTTIKELINDFYSKVPEKDLFEHLNKGKFYNKNDTTFYIKEDIYEKLNIDDKTVSDYLVNKIKDTTLILMEVEKLSCSNTNDTFKNYIKKFNIYVKYKSTYKHLSSNMEEYIINNIIFIGKPIINGLGYYIYKKNTSQLKVVNIEEETLSKVKINFFSSISAYCNANNFLYIYEGTNMMNSTFTSRFTRKSSCFFNNNKFIRINLINEEIQIISIKFPRRILHSMIFVPEKYIFVIGGKYKKEIKDVLIYKIKKDNYSYEKYPHLLPYELLEPSLIMINNKFLYAFENSKEKFNVVKCNISNISPFEDIKLKNEILIGQKFFGVIPKISKNRILFLGGQYLDSSNNISLKNYEFDFNTNELILTNINYKKFDFIEKTFIPIDKNNYMQITEFRQNNEYLPKIIIFGDKKKSIIDEEEEKSKSKGKYFEEGFDSVESRNIKVFISNKSVQSEDSNSIVPSSSNDEIFV
jgi:hypothetical protein